MSSDEEVETEHKKMKIDLSCVSFLKPHIINEKVYKLAQQGFAKDNLKKSEQIKNME